MLGAFEVGRHPQRSALQHLDELPALFAPLVQDLLQGVRDQRHGGVFPLLLVQGSSKDLRDPQSYPRETARNLLQMKLCVADPNVTVASEVRWARSGVDRARGLIGVTALPSGVAMVFEPARQIHTFGMKFPLDVVFCDSQWEVVHVVRSMVPHRVTRFVWRAHFAIELAGGSLPANVQAGSLLNLTP